VLGLKFDARQYLHLYCACQALGTVVADAYEIFVHALLTYLQNEFKE